MFGLFVWHNDRFHRLVVIYALKGDCAFRGVQSKKLFYRNVAISRDNTFFGQKRIDKVWRDISDSAGCVTLQWLKNRRQVYLLHFLFCRSLGWMLVYISLWVYDEHNKIRFWELIFSRWHTLYHHLRVGCGAFDLFFKKNYGAS